MTVPIETKTWRINTIFADFKIKYKSEFNLNSNYFLTIDIFLVETPNENFSILLPLLLRVKLIFIFF